MDIKEKTVFMKVRGFEICEKYKDADINLPKRQTIASAGYDLEAAEDCVIPSIWRLNFVRIFRLIRNGHELNERDYEYADQILQPIMVHTGVKAYNNPNNEGELMVQMINYGVRPIHIKKGERVAQVIFMKYLRTDDDAPVSRQRIGGFGSTKK